MIVIRVNGLPAPQGSKRHVGHGRMIESSKAVGPWREAVRSETQRVMESGAVPYADGAVSMTVAFWLARPRSHYGTGRNALVVKLSSPVRPAARKRNDIDKLLRAVLDGVTEGGAIADDGLVASLICDKYYADDNPPGCYVIINGIGRGG